MPTLTVTAKGQITLKKDLLAHLGVAPGQKLAVEMLPGGKIGVRAEAPAADISEAFGCLKGKCRKRLSIEEIGQIAAAGWAGKR